MLVAWLSLLLASAVLPLASSLSLAASSPLVSAPLTSSIQASPSSPPLQPSACVGERKGGREEGRVSVGVRGREEGERWSATALYAFRACICATAAVCVCGSPPRGLRLLDLMSQPRQAIVEHKLRQSPVSYRKYAAGAQQSTRSANRRCCKYCLSWVWPRLAV